MKKQKLLMMIMIAGVSLAVAAQQKKSTAEANLGYNRVVDGAQLYKMYCAACHGIDGKGAGPAAQAMKHPPADLSASHAARAAPHGARWDHRTVFPDP